jgi:hypothetical protein
MTVYGPFMAHSAIYSLQARSNAWDGTERSRGAPHSDSASTRRVLTVSLSSTTIFSTLPGAFLPAPELQPEIHLMKELTS